MISNSNKQLSTQKSSTPSSTSHTPNGILKKATQVENADYEKRTSNLDHDDYGDTKSQDADSDDSTATRIIEKSELFHNFEEKRRMERPKSSYISHPEPDTIVIQRPKTVDGGTELKLMLEIEPIDRITIRTPPKTPESKGFTPKSSSVSTTITFSNEKSDKEPAMKSPSPTFLPSDTPIPLPPPPLTSAKNTLPHPSTPGPIPPESFQSNHTSPSPSPVSASDIMERSPTPEQRSRTQSYIEQPITPRPDSNKPTIPHFNAPQSIQPLSNDSYESTTDTEHQQQPTNFTRKIPRAVPKKVKPVTSQPSLPAKKEKVERPRDLLVNCFLKLQSLNWEANIEVNIFFKVFLVLGI